MFSGSLLGGLLQLRRPHLGCGHRRFSGDATFLSLRGFGGRMSRALLLGHSRVRGSLRSGYHLGGSLLLGHSRASGSLRCLRRRCRRPLLFSNPRVSRATNRLFGRPVRLQGFGFGLGPRRFRRGATFFGSLRSGSRLGGSLLFGYARVSRTTNRCFGRPVRFQCFGFGLSPSRFGGGATFLGRLRRGSGIGGSLLFGHSRVGGSLRSLCCCRGRFQRALSGDVCVRGNLRRLLS
jgi:hypothetical protein